jgi:large subunit ribosomal protein L32
MAVPRSRTSRSKRNSRRSHDALTPINLGKCTNCNAPKLSHSACESCGFYKGRFLPKNILKADLIAALR